MYVETALHIHEFLMMRRMDCNMYGNWKKYWYNYKNTNHRIPEYLVLLPIHPSLFDNAM